MLLIRFPLLLGLGVILLTSGCVRPYGGALLNTSPIRDTSLEDLRLLYQKEQEGFPPLKGLMEITFRSKREKVHFWAQWTSNAEGITINGFNFLGGALFDFKTTPQEVHFTTADSKGTFHGSREAFRRYLLANSKRSKHPLRTEWLVPLDWMARGGTPDLSRLDHTTLEKQEERLILHAFMDRESKTFLAQKWFIERRGFRVTDAFLFDPEGAPEMQIRFSDYRPVYGRPSEDADPQSGLPDMTGGTWFPFHIQIEAGDFYGEAVFMELYAGGASAFQ